LTLIYYIFVHSFYIQFLIYKFISYCDPATCVILYREVNIEVSAELYVSLFKKVRFISHIKLLFLKKLTPFDKLTVSKPSHNSPSSRNVPLLTAFTNTHSRSLPSISSLSVSFLSVIPKCTATSQLHNPSHPVKNANHQASHYTIFSISLSLIPAHVQPYPQHRPVLSGPGERLARGWTVRGSNPGGRHSTRARPDRSWGPPSGCRVISGEQAPRTWSKPFASTLYVPRLKKE
jgi:hypothetical protein